MSRAHWPSFEDDGTSPARLGNYDLRHRDDGSAYIASAERFVGLPLEIIVRLAVDRGVIPVGDRYALCPVWVTDDRHLIVFERVVEQLNSLTRWGTGAEGAWRLS